MKRTTRPVKIVPEILGWYGVVAIIAAYIAVSFNFMSAHGLSYQLLNGSGALAMVVDGYYQKDYQPLVLNVVWALIACIALIKFI